ncbi:MAG: hypothetical protein QOC82_1400 [Frankiaceae bacterium]|jgi:hypothetical protein|nr:hypothetical protein [Frankiaceae bacterium]
MRHRTKLAALALAAPLALPVAAHAAMDPNVCNVAAGGSVTSFNMTCASTNDDAGAYSISITWATVSPCFGAGAPVSAATYTGTATGTTPEGSISGSFTTAGAVSGAAPALAVVYPNNPTGDLSIGYSTPGNDGTERHTMQLQFTCTSGGLLEPTGQVWELDATSVGNSPNSAYCSYGNVTGPVTFTPGLGASGPTNYTMTLTLNCVGANGTVAGTYAVTITGTDGGGCLGGSGTGTISGTGPGGVPVSGAWMYGRHGVHYYGFPPSGTGFIHMGGQTYGFYLWLDLVPTGLACPVYAGSIVGHGIVMGV